MATPQVFISYSHSDDDWARQFAESLVNQGLNVWYDQQIVPGESWSDAIATGIRESPVMLFVISPEYINRPNLFLELGAAVGMKKTIIPVIDEDFDRKRLPPPLQRIKALVRKSPDETAREVSTALKMLYGEAA